MMFMMNFMNRMLVNTSRYNRINIKYNVINKRFINISHPLCNNINEKINIDVDKDNVDYHYVQRAIQNNTHLLIDVRPDYISKEGTIPGSINIPISHFTLFSGRDTMIGLFGKEIEKDQHIILFCQMGNTSALGKILLNTLGFDNVYNYKGSYLDWVEKEQACPDPVV